MTSLDIAVSTYKPSGIKKIEKMILPRIEGVCYIVSWQDHEDAPVSATLKERDDVKIYRYDGKGLSNNRNNAISHCSSDLILIADDDLRYDEKGIRELIDSFERHPDTDIGLYKVVFKGKKKAYPDKECEIKIPLPQGYYVSSVEIAFRRDSLGELRFYPGLGLGSETMSCGEEELFLLSALHRKMNCRFFPIEICSHPEETTGSVVSESVLLAQGFIMQVYYPHSCMFRLPLKAIRVWRKSGVSFYKILQTFFKGASLASKKWNEIPVCYRWP